ncbi:MAG TPA: hypothetical protein DHW71_15160 [Gammaproteobacteria bacterium]|nr:hypothetical protein [Gammaproteobacteria bacterium]
MVSPVSLNAKHDLQGEVMAQSASVLPPQFPWKKVAKVSGITALGGTALGGLGAVGTASALGWGAIGNAFAHVGTTIAAPFIAIGGAASRSLAGGVGSGIFGLWNSLTSCSKTLSPQCKGANAFLDDIEIIGYEGEGDIAPLQIALKNDRVIKPERDFKGRIKTNGKEGYMAKDDIAYKKWGQLMPGSKTTREELVYKINLKINEKFANLPPGTQPDHEMKNNIVKSAILETLKKDIKVAQIRKAVTASSMYLLTGGLAGAAAGAIMGAGYGAAPGVAIGVLVGAALSAATIAGAINTYNSELKTMTNIIDNNILKSSIATMPAYNKEGTTISTIVEESPYMTYRDKDKINIDVLNSCHQQLRGYHQKYIEDILNNKPEAFESASSIADSHLTSRSSREEDIIESSSNNHGRPFQLCSDSELSLESALDPGFKYA